MRIDRLLWFLRFARTRGTAQRWIEEGHIRRNGQRVTKRKEAIRIGDVLTLPLAHRVCVIRISALPTRRGPKEEVRQCYEELDAGGAIAIAGGDSPI
ncbi:RNA-binding S4 domain-containing protein [Altericroceibacterium endophyticum]|uniref:RNA-binding S4 domain-containing protein n=1 Tax=Altericroceibacterium endophyticum TaxID=1808508 RepID=A0A6I4T436_9SPHN|nr:S4 domain-containing protein [Altericroceibacterium endophyticum]MXO65667.1 RNA-binding S4 domain-containing protein [Altericroceibacterium endophyticum]